MNTTTNVIAERVLACVPDPKQTLKVTLFEPVPGLEALDYECSFQLTGSGINLVRSAAGLDSFQALQLALVMIGAEIAQIERRSEHRFIFGDLDNSGFPAF